MNLASNPESGISTLACNNGAKGGREWRWNDYREKFGLEPENYGNLLIDQDYKCGICQRDLLVMLKGRASRYVHVDHDHDTGKVRGVLCANCNQFEGWWKKYRTRLEEWEKKGK